MRDSDPHGSPIHKRRPRYAGKNPRRFHEKYKELSPDRYAGDVQKIRESGKTPAGSHVPIMIAEVLRVLSPKPGDVVVDATLGGGGHARALLERIRPGGRLLGLDVDPIERPRTEAAMRAEGAGAEEFATCHSNFAGITKVIAGEGLAGADVILADLGVSSMQLDNPDRGFSYKEPGALDMRMNPARGEPASQVIARTNEDALARILNDHADEPQAALIARLLKGALPTTTNEAERVVRLGLNEHAPRLSKAEVKASVRRTFQALRIAVNDEFAALDAFLRALPLALNPGGRVAVITFHSGEDRRVKKAFQAGFRDGTYSAKADDVIRASMEETRANRRASSAKLRWAIRTQPETR